MEGPRFTHSLPQGIELIGSPADETVEWWLKLANNEGAPQLERVSAFIVLLQKGTPLEVRRLDG